MISKNELRIGNLILDDNGNPISVTSITESMVCSDNWGFEYENAKPVLLTPKILERVGFSHFTNGWYEVKTPNHIELSINIELNRIAIDVNRQQVCFDIECQYLHQLQNIYFSLVNTELKIKEIA